MPAKTVTPISADVILIPKQLRMEWTDAMALDPDVPPLAFKVACAIGYHFNKHRGNTYIKQETIAVILGISPRAVWSAVMTIERLGYLIVERRELGFRSKDGRRVCGGRGVANTYRPAFERSSLGATSNGTMLAARCDLLWEQRSQNRVKKVAPPCDPTLSDTSYQNPCQHSLGKPGDRLAMMLGDKVFSTWFGGVSEKSGDELTVTLIAPKASQANWLRENFQTQIIECWRREGRQVDFVMIEAAVK